MEIDESTMARIIKKMGYKENSDFYKDVAEEKLDVNTVVEKYIEERDHDLNLSNANKPAESAENFEFENPTEELLKQSDDVLVIDEHLKGIDFELSHCCHPIYGDPIFGFVTISKGIKIHRIDCPNAKELRRRFGYRIVKAKWSGKGTSKYAITLRIIGNDDIGIVSNITNIISKEDKLVMRGINISSKDGLFSGNVTVMIDDAGKTDALHQETECRKGRKAGYENIIPQMDIFLICRSDYFFYPHFFFSIFLSHRFHRFTQFFLSIYHKEKVQLQTNGIEPFLR